MVLLPCSACCGGPTCTCPTCYCCVCDTWQATYDLQQRTPTPPYTESYYKEIYDDLLSLLPGCITRLYESQSECVDALVAQAMATYGMTEAEVRAAFQSFWEEYDCQNYVSKVGSTWHGWSVPYIIGNGVASPAALEELCPGGSPPSPLYCGTGQTSYWRIPEFTTASGIPDIRHLVLNTPATGDWIADALLTRGTQEDLPANGWVEADDCASCDDPAVLEFACNPADLKVFYDKVITVRDSWPNLCAPETDELGLCPPENCKIVNIKVTRTDQCSPTSLGNMEWEVEVAVCPCSAPFLLVSPANENNDPIVLAAYGYASEADCIADLTNENCLGGTPESRCIGNQWREVRHYTEEGYVGRACLSFECSSPCSPGPQCCS